MNRRVWLVPAAVVPIFLGAMNCSALAPVPDGGPRLMAHRGLAQAYDRQGLTNETCTAARLLPTGHGFLENTLPSMDAAFELGADVVEIDVHLTSDGHFAVFHDWTLDCRTEGTGVTHDHTLAELQQVDVGYGYTADGGATFPFRGTGAGAMPSLTQVLTTFPDRDFFVDLKSGDPKEGEALAELLSELLPLRTGEVMIGGGTAPTQAVLEQHPELRSLTKPALKSCLGGYIALGWTGWVPSACERQVLLVPANVAPWLWGWPNRFLQRMEASDAEVFVVGDYGGEGFSSGFDDPDRLSELGEDFGGGIRTDRIDLISLALDR